MKYTYILLVLMTLISCSEDNSQTSNDYLKLADEYGVSDIIEVKEGFDKIDRQEWIEILELAVQMKKDVELSQKQHELQKEVIRKFKKELNAAENDEQRQEVWNRYGAKYDWIVTADDGNIE